MSAQDDIRAAFQVPSVFSNHQNVTVASPGMLRITFGESHSDVVARPNFAVTIQITNAEDLIDLIRRIIDEHAAQLHR